MSEGTVRYARRGDIHLLRFVGDIRYSLSPSLEAFLDQLFKGASPERCLIDLSQVSSIDSTNLGLIARIANRMPRSPERRTVLVSNNADINEVLNAMGFSAIFDLVQHSDEFPEEMQPLPLRVSEPEALARTVLDAHRNLMAVSSVNEERFRDLVTLLEQRDDTKRERDG
jgi:anti-anti-sigma factor